VYVIDLARNTRPVDLPEVPNRGTGTTADLGAYERQQFPVDSLFRNSFE
jgi:hypothetical protein